MNTKVFFIVFVIVSTVAFSNTILTYPNSMSVVRGNNITFTVFIGGSGKCSVWTSGRYSTSPKSVDIRNDEVERFLVTYISTEPCIGERYITLYATNAVPVKIKLTVLPNDGDKKVINETFANYAKKLNYIRDKISNDPNATANGMFGLTNIVIEKLWIVDSYIRSGNYYEAAKLMNDMKPQLSALESYTGTTESPYKGYVIIIVGICVLILSIVIFEVARHFMLK